VFATDLNDTAVQDMMKNHIAVALDTLEMTEEDLDKSKVFKQQKQNFVAERISKLTFDKRILLEDLDFINVNGVKVAFTSSVRRHRWKKGSWTPFFGFSK
jgi:hypothetical protein